MVQREINTIKKVAKVDFDWTSSQSDFRQKVAELLDATVVEAGISKDSGGFWEDSVHARVPAEERARRSKFVSGKLAEHGYLTPNWPIQYGGLDLPVWESAILSEEVMLRGEPRGSQYMNTNYIGPSIILAGNDEQKDYFLKRIAAGDITFCQGFSEPEAGSDLAALRCQAVREGDEYVVNGEKIWTSHTAVADYCYLLVRTSTSEDKHEGISILIFPVGTPGMEIYPIPAVGGGVSELSFANLRFVNMRVPVAARLGPEGEGWPIIRKALAFERLGIPGHIQAQLRLDRVILWARSTGVLDNPRILEAVGRARAWCEASRLLYYKAIDEVDSDFANPTFSASVARLATVRAERVVSEIATEIALMHGLIEGTPAAEYMWSIATGIAAGAYEVQLNLIWRAIASIWGADDMDNMVPQPLA
jgi:alkylation response protein AidB-like acyl-CoA dehydrogenase